MNERCLLLKDKTKGIANDMELANRGPRKGLRSKTFWGEEAQWNE